MTKEEFMEWLQGISEDELEPFCPFNHPWFGHGYCNVAYSMHCYDCEYRIDNNKEE